MVDAKRDGRLARYEAHYLVTGAPLTSKNGRNQIEPYKIMVTWHFNFNAGVWHPTRVLITGWLAKNGTSQIEFTNDDTFPDWVDLLLIAHTPNFEANQAAS